MSAHLKVNCDRSAIVEALSLASAVVPTRTTTPVLSCLKLTAKDGLERQMLTGADGLAGSKFWLVPVEHDGCRNASNEEVEAVGDVFGQGATLAGFYSYGEISPFVNAMECKLHNQTMTITYLTER